jgi:glycerophosphoryl diester phosphodiesterase
MPPTFELQGHRGARGLKPENTLPSFEVALDLGVTSIETDVHLTRDGVPVLYHDERISARLCRLRRGQPAPDPATEPLVSSLRLAELGCYRANRNPDRRRFPDQTGTVTRLAHSFTQRGCDPYSPPTLANLFALADLYWGHGDFFGKEEAQCRRAGRVIFDLELKRVPSRPEIIGDDFALWADKFLEWAQVPYRPKMIDRDDFERMGRGLLEWRVIEAARSSGKDRRTRVRSFDHRALRVLKSLDPELPTAVLIAETAPVDPVALAKSAGADTYCPDYRFLDAAQVRACHAGGVRVLPWTVNDEADWLRLIDMGVDGITTDHPDRLAELLRSRGIEY